MSSKEYGVSITKKKLTNNFPTTNLEALACGTPVITFRTGGSGESVDDSCGKVVAKGDYEG